VAELVTPDRFPGTPDHRLRSIIRFTLPSTGERWNWPVATSDKDALDAFCEILDRADIPWTVSHA